MKILIAYGTRPEYIKILPLLKAFNGQIQYKTLFTGQHTTLIGEHKPDYFLTIKDDKNRLDSIVQSVLNCPDEYFKEITHVLVQGDTTSAFSLALAAFHRNIKIIHLESGLRTFDLHAPFPEEANRQLISRLADINLCPTELNASNLRAERCNGQIYVVGNTVLDNLVNFKNDITYKNIIPITLHRRENHFQIDKYFHAINNIANSHPEYKFILPIHPNPNVIKHRGILNAANINICEPLPYEEMINLIVKCKFIISDSGGIQEEASFLKKRVIICRELTERMEGVFSLHHKLCPKPENLSDLFEEFIINFIPENTGCPFGDGYTSQRITDLLLELTLETPQDTFAVNNN